MRSEVTLKATQVVQYFLCKDFGRRFNECSGTPMARLRTPIETISMAINACTEDLGIRAAGRVLGKSPNSILLCEKRLSAQLPNFIPPSSKAAEATIEGDEVYTRVGKNLPPSGSVKVGTFISSTVRVAIGSRLAGS